MTKRICLIQGHPDGNGGHLCHALADAYADAARFVGHAVDRIDVGSMEVPFLASAEAFKAAPTGAILAAQETVNACDHLVVVYPLWLGSMPGKLKAFLENLACGEFLVSAGSEGGWPKKHMKGRSARVIVTMGMPATAYRLLFGKAGVKSMEQGILELAGFSPVHDTLFGMVEAANDATRAGWLKTVSLHGEKGD